MKKNNSRIQSVLVPAVAIACVVGGGIAIAQTKQLKEPAAPAVKQEENDENAQPVLQNGSRSYSVVIENQTQPNGKTKQTKKVWQDGQLVEESETELDGDAADATITLPNGVISNGNVFEDLDPFSSLSDDATNGSPFESLRRMEEQLRQQHERMREQFEALRRQLAQDGATPNLNGQIAPLPNRIGSPILSSSKYWLGVSIDRVPEILLAQLPIEENKGALVQFVAPDSPAAKAGLKRYDVIVKIGDEEVNDPRNVSEQVEKIGANKTKIEYYRKGALNETEVEIVERPATPIQATPGKSFTVVRPGLIVPDDSAAVAQPEVAPSSEPVAEENE